MNIVTERDSGQPRSFAFVEMTQSNEGQKAISQLNGTELGGRALNVGRGGFGGPRTSVRRGGRW